MVEVFEIEMIKGQSDDEVYLYLSRVLGVVMKSVVLLTVAVRQRHLSQHRTGPEALLQDLVVSGKLESKEGKTHTDLFQEIRNIFIGQ